MAWLVDIIVFSIIFFIIGIYIGANKSKTVGDLIVDETDPEDGPYLFLQLDTHPQELKFKNKATFNVKIKTFVSHE